MKKVMENLSVVVIAKDFNLSIMKPLWLVRNQIFREKELEGDIVITPPALQIPSPNFQFMALPDRVQIAISRPYDAAESHIKRVIGGIVTVLPHTPYTAVGFNFHYLAAPESVDTKGNWERDLFAAAFSNEVPGAKQVDARFGSYLSFDAIGSRLKIDIKPTNAADKVGLICEAWKPGQELVRIHFNFHTDLTNADEPARAVTEKLEKWAEAFAFSKELTNKIFE